MSLAPVLRKLDLIESTPRITEKIELLRQFMENSMFLRVVKYTLEGTKHYGIQKFPDFKEKIETKPDNRLRKIFGLLDALSKSKGASDLDKAELFKYASIDAETVEVVRRILVKDLRCGASEKSINKAVPNTIRIMPYMRCSTEKKIDNLTFDNDPAQSLPNVIAQEKADGAFVNVLINSIGQIKFLTRNGKIVQQLGTLKKLISSQKPEKQYGGMRGIMNDPKKSHFSRVFNGELLVMRNGKVLGRKTGNGIINQCIQGTASKKDADSVVLRLWDSITLQNFWLGSEGVSYSDRLYKTRNFVSTVNDPRVSLVETRYVHTYEEAREFYSELRADGKEGAVLKQRTTTWKDGTSATQVKMKNVIDVELILIGWYHGDPDRKYKKCIGGLICETACGKLRVNLGGGFTDKERGYFPKKSGGQILDPNDIDLEKAQEACDFFEMQEGAIVGAECESVIKSKSKGLYSLFLPVYCELRFDKHKADTLKDILER